MKSRKCTSFSSYHFQVEPWNENISCRLGVIKMLIIACWLTKSLISCVGKVLLKFTERLFNWTHFLVMIEKLREKKLFKKFKSLKSFLFCIFRVIKSRPGHFQFLPLSATVKNGKQRKCPGLGFNTRLSWLKKFKTSWNYFHFPSNRP